MVPQEWTGFAQSTFVLNLGMALPGASQSIIRLHFNTFFTTPPHGLTEPRLSSCSPVGNYERLLPTSGRQPTAGGLPLAMYFPLLLFTACFFFQSL